MSKGSGDKRWFDERVYGPPRGCVFARLGCKTQPEEGGTFFTIDVEVPPEGKRWT